MVHRCYELVAQAQQELALAREAVDRARGADDPDPYLLEEAAALLASHKGGVGSRR
jgi:hypothetical protein